MFSFINELFWSLVSKILSTQRVASWLVHQAMKTPYTPITSRSGDKLYMRRWWLFNPYPASGAKKAFGMNWLPSVRVHHILEADDAPDKHDHPWNARTIILHGFYCESRLNAKGAPLFFVRKQGQSASLRFGEYHSIDSVSQDGVLTLFITYKYRGIWGFLVNNKKVNFKTYLEDKANGS
jgi:hypothetical protein